MIRTRITSQKIVQWQAAEEEEAAASVLATSMAQAAGAEGATTSSSCGLLLTPQYYSNIITGLHVTPCATADCARCAKSYAQGAAFVVSAFVGVGR